MSTEYKGSIQIKIADKTFELTGEIGDTIEVGWRAGNVELGKLSDILGSVAKALVGDAEAAAFSDQLNGPNGVMSNLNKVAGLGDIITKLLSVNLFVTDLYIKAVKKDTGFTVANAAFGFRGEFDPGTIKLGPVELLGFGVLFEYTKNLATGEVEGRGATRQIPARA